jgi:hypothetical protein
VNLFKSGMDGGARAVDGSQRVEAIRAFGDTDHFGACTNLSGAKDEYLHAGVDRRGFLLDAVSTRGTASLSSSSTRR